MKKRPILIWLFGVLFTFSVLLSVTLCDIASLLKWQSIFLSRSFFVIMFCFGLCLFRLLAGPSTVDRIVAVNALGVLIVGFCVILSVFTKREWYINIAIAWILQSFVGILALTKYMEGRNFDE